MNCVPVPDSLAKTRVLSTEITGPAKQHIANSLSKDSQGPRFIVDARSSAEKVSDTCGKLGK